MLWQIWEKIPHTHKAEEIGYVIYAGRNRDYRHYTAFCKRCLNQIHYDTQFPEKKWHTK